MLELLIYKSSIFYNIKFLNINLVVIKLIIFYKLIQSRKFNDIIKKFKNSIVYKM